MCSCEPGWVCAKCRDTRADDSYLDDEPGPSLPELPREPSEFVSG
jgi:hypothetical protein